MPTNENRTTKIHMAIGCFIYPTIKYTLKQTANWESYESRKIEKAIERHNNDDDDDDGNEIKWQRIESNSANKLQCVTWSV